MATLAQTVKKVRSNDFEKGLLNVVSLNDKKALNLNRDVQLFTYGSDSKGNFLKEYADITVVYKRTQGQPYDRTTLRDTEAFHNSFFMDASKFPVRIDATDSKTSELKTKYGEAIFGLDEESQTEFNDSILEDVQNAFRKAVGI